MSTYKSKILNYKPKPNPQLWEKIENKVAELNRENKSRSKLFPKLRLSIILIATLTVLGFIGQKFYPTSHQKMAAKPTNEKEVVLSQNLSIDSINQNLHSDDSQFMQKTSIALVTSQSETSSQIQIAKTSPASNENKTLLVMKNIKLRNSINEDMNVAFSKKLKIENMSDSETKIMDNDSAYDLGTEKNSQNSGREFHSKATASETKLTSTYEEMLLPVFKMDILTIPLLDDISQKTLYSINDPKDKLSPCNPTSYSQKFIETGGSFGFGTNSYPGYYINFLIDFRINKLIRTGFKINHQRYSSAAKFITAPDILDSRRYTNLLANVSLMLFDNQKLSLALDFSPGLGLVTENHRKQNGDDFYISKNQYYGFNYLVGASIDFRMHRLWKLGFESSVDVNRETTLNGLKIKYIL